MTAKKNILLLLLLLTVLTIKGKAQSYGNEWINYGQKYYSFNVYTTGVHKLDYATLSAAGIDLDGLNSDYFQIFGREREIPLYIEDGADSELDPGDYILFFAEKNDGWLDSTLYDTPDDIGNPKYSLYNDTIQYFFTWNSSTSNLRYTIETDLNFSSYTPSNYILFERFQSNSDSYNEGMKTSDASSSVYTSGEGWGSSPVNGAGGHTWDASAISIDQVYQGADAPNVEYSAVSVGVSNASFGGAGNHHVRHTIGSSNYVIADTIFTGYKAVHIKKNFPASILPASGGSNFKVSIIPDQGAVTDYQSINYWSFVYPRIPNLSGANNSRFNVKNNPQQSKIRIDLNNLSTTDPVVFVLGDVP
ncbi:MAG: hypothetical protein ACK46O_09775, partial [Flavobacteriia bacterium]